MLEGKELVGDVDDSNNNQTTAAQLAFAEARKAEAVAFSRDHPATVDHPIVWKGGATLGSGAYGSASVYFSEDESGFVQDRIVAKDTILHNRDQWVSWENICLLSSGPDC